MDRLVVLAVVLAIVVIGYRAVARRCREAPERRPWFVVASIVTLGVAAALVPWVLADLNPPWSESPAGIFVYLGKALVVGVPGLAALGGLAGAIFPGSSGSREA